MLLFDHHVGPEAARLRVRGAVDTLTGIYAAELRGVRWDASLLPAADTGERRWRVLLYLLDGGIASASAGIEYDAGTLLMVPESAVFPAIGSDAPALRTLTPFVRGLAVRFVAPEKDRGAIEAVVDPGPIGDTMRAAYDQLRQGELEDSTVHGALDAIATACRDTLPPSPSPRTDARDRAIGELLLRGFSTLRDQPMLVDLAEEVARTERQVRRDLLRAQEQFDLLDRGFRPAMVRWRLTMAVMLLSSPALRPADVAAEVGYGSVTAMGLAFRQAGLLSPSQIKRHFLA